MVDAVATSMPAGIVGGQLGPRIAQREPVGLHVDDLAAQQPQHRLERLPLHAALVDRVDAHHVRVQRDLARPGADDQPAARLQIELGDAVRGDQRMVVRQRHHTGAESDALRALGRRSDEHVWRWDDFGSGGVVLTHPRLVETQMVQVFHQVDVTPQLQCRVGVEGVIGRQERPELDRARIPHARHAIWIRLIGSSDPEISPQNARWVTDGSVRNRGGDRLRRRRNTPRSS